MARKFFYVCAGLFLLALSFHSGARSAGAQNGSVKVVGIAGDGNYDVWQAVTDNGDVYRSKSNHGTQWVHVGNVFAGATIALPDSVGQSKAKSR